MPEALIIGSGPAAAGVALALAPERDLAITVLDLGAQLEPERAEVVGALATGDRADWDEADLALVTSQPVASAAGGLPEKRSFGSDFAFRDLGQLDRIGTRTGVHRSLVSGAYGGFSNVWGAQVMPFSAATFETWPLLRDEMEPHYRAVLGHVPFAAEEDDLAERFPLIGPARPLPPVSPRTQLVLERYRRHRTHLQKLGVTVGKARLAFDAARCDPCGLCMTGCPWHLIYSASQTFDELRRRRRIAYHSGLLALEVHEARDQVTVSAKELSTGRVRRFTGDRAFLACGAMGTTRIALQSLRLFEKPLTMGESVQFTLPVLSRQPTPDPRNDPQFTLNQFNMVVAMDRLGQDLSQLHFYAFNPAFVDALPRPLRLPAAEPATGRLLRRLGVALGYLPSWASPRLIVTARPPSAPAALPEITIDREPPDWASNDMLRGVLAKVARSARMLDLYPVIPQMRLAAGGKSYHWGASFPHRSRRHGPFSSDRLGRVGPWERTHLVDASVFPNVPATTFTLTIMANAHRIATETLALA